MKERIVQSLAVVALMAILAVGATNAPEEPVDVTKPAKLAVESVDMNALVTVAVQPNVETLATSAVIEETVLPEVVLTDAEIDLLAIVTMAEAEGECEEGKRLVIDTILNRVDSDGFPDTVHGVVYQSGQFSSMWNGRSDRCYVKDEIRQLVIEEAQSRYNHDVLYFRTNHFFSWGTPLFQVGSHYFSGK